MFWVFLVCVVIATLLYINDKEITTFEYVITIIVISIVSLVSFLLTTIPITNDIMYQSGRIRRVEFHPFFVEQYTQVHTQVYPCGKSTCVRTYTTTEYEKHEQYWLAIDTLGQRERITMKQYYEMGGTFKSKESHTHPNRNRYGGHKVKGDDTLYSFTDTVNTYEYPTNEIVKWKNPLKKSKSIFSHKETIEYPESDNWRVSNRNSINSISTKQFDIMNTKIYEKVGANVILTTANSMKDAESIKNSWNNGKKNDIVIVIIGNNFAPSQVKVFSWSTASILNSALETYILDNGISYKNLDDIAEIIIKYYKPFDFENFNYLKTAPEWWQILIGAIFVLFALLRCYSEFSTNWDSRQ